MSLARVPSIEEVRTAANEFAEGLATAYYLRQTRGQDTTADWIARFNSLATPPVIELVRDALRLLPPKSDRRKLERLLAALVLFRDDVRLDPIDQQLRQMEERAGAVVAADRGVTSFAGLRQRLVVEPERAARERLDAARATVTEQVTQTYLWRADQLDAMASEEGAADFATYRQRWLGIDLDATERMVEVVLERTESVYRAELQHYLALAGVPAGTRPALHDLVFLAGQDPFPDHFRHGSLLAGTQRVLGDAGIDVFAGGRVSFEVGDTEGGPCQAYTYPLNMPERVILYSPTCRGVFAYYNFFHELGHALHFSHVERSLPFEYKLLGDDSLTEGYAMLFGHLVANPSWIAEVAGEAISQDFIRFNYFRELVLFRRYAIKLSANLKLHRDRSRRAAPAWYEDLVSRILGARVDASIAHLEFDARFYSARYLRAWIMEGCLDARLQALYGPEWYRSRDAATSLKNAWATGQEFGPEQILPALFGIELNPSDLADRFYRWLA